MIFQTVSPLLVAVLAATTPAFAAHAPGKKGSSANHKLKQTEALTPEGFLEKQIEGLKTEIDNQPLAPAQDPGTETEGPIQIETGSDKQSWLTAIYKHHLVNTSHLSEALADRLLLAELVKTVMKDAGSTPIPRTVGLKGFLEINNLVNKYGTITADGDQIEAALHKTFPAGFIVRPAVGIVATETEVGLFRNSDQFIVELLKQPNSLYDPATYMSPIKSHILGAIGSGEAVVLQDNIVLATDADKPLHVRHAVKIRLHTYEDHVIPDAIPRRWVRGNVSASSEEAKIAETFVQEFLRLLPKGLLARQAWSIEVSVFDNGSYKITDLVTNRGRPGTWSSYLDEPRILQAYTKFFEASRNVEFTGFAGWLLRHGFADYFHYWHVRIEKAPWFWHKIWALFPPWP